VTKSKGQMNRENWKDSQRPVFVNTEHERNGWLKLMIYERGEEAKTYQSLEQAVKEGRMAATRTREKGHHPEEKEEGGRDNRVGF